MLRKHALTAALSLISLLTLGTAIVHAQTEEAAGVIPQTFILVHGAFQDASGWDATIAALEANGHTAIAVNLPGRGDDSTPANELTSDLYRDTVIEVINQQAAPVVLVGHSAGGLTISNVAEAIPDQIAAVVYLAAYLPQTGNDLNTLAGIDRYGAGSQGKLVPSEDFANLIFTPEDEFAQYFCPDCSAEQATVVNASYISEPIPPLSTPVTLTPENFGSVRKIYIMTAGDLVVSPQLQALMIANTPVDHVFALTSGHVPYITQPEALAALLTDPRVVGSM